MLSMVSMLSCSNPEPEDYLLPEGFKGRATVIFNQKEGASPKYENGKRVYEIPANGILLTQFKDEYGIVNHHYYYVDSNGKRTALPIYQYEYNKDGTTKWIVKNENETGIFSDGTTGQYGEGTSAPFQFFTVSSYNGLDTIESNDIFNHRINKLIGANL